MSYLVLARKYRPKSFTEMVGQEHVVQALSNALTQQRLHHAYLFTGTRGAQLRGRRWAGRHHRRALRCV
jgi:DNA polymerase III subunit gamma/tau